MKSGFKVTVDKILRSYGLKTSDCIGTVWADGDINWRLLNAMGYRVEQGINNPDYDYIILSKNKSTLKNILLALTLIKVGCIIIFRADGELKSLSTWNTLSRLLGLWIYEYDNGKILGVIFKRKEI